MELSEDIERRLVGIFAIVGHMEEEWSEEPKNLEVPAESPPPGWTPLPNHDQTITNHLKLGVMIPGATTSTLRGH